MIMIQVPNLSVPNTGYLAFNWKLTFWQRVLLLCGFPISVEFQSTESSTKVNLGLYREFPEVTVTFHKN